MPWKSSLIKALIRTAVAALVFLTLANWLNSAPGAWIAVVVTFFAEGLIERWAAGDSKPAVELRARIEARKAAREAGR